MSKIEKYKDAKATAGSVALAVQHILGRDSPSNDKHTFYVRFDGLSKEMFQPMTFSIDASYGYYGSSSGYSATSKALGHYLAMAIKDQKSALLDYAALLASNDAEAARKDAEKEAQSVLQQAAE